MKGLIAALDDSFLCVLSALYTATLLKAEKDHDWPGYDQIVVVCTAEHWADGGLCHNACLSTC
jgi:hypothetical protein